MSGTTPLIALALLLGSAAAELTESSYQRWRETIVPTKAELGWQEIPWRTSFWQALLEAQEAEKPVLLWAMNGHPLGCT